MWSQTNPFAVVLCTCNGERHLDRQLQTLRVQQGVTEIVVVDDASTDGTWDILLMHAAKDGRFRLHRNVTRLGVTRNFEHALRLVASPWVALADQDDVWLPGKMARLRAAWDGRAGLLHHATRKFRDREPAVLPSPAGEGRKFSGSDLRCLLYRNSVVGHTILVRTDLARRLMPFPRRVPHDWWLGVGAALRDRVQYVDEYLVHYRIHGNNAYHAAGSRWRRLGAEHRLRLELLRALPGWCKPGTVAADFVNAYRRLLETAQRGSFSWPLWRYYFRHAGLLFGGGQPLSPGRRFRKSLQAALGAMLWASPADPGRVLRPHHVEKPAAAPAVRRAG